MKTLKLLPFLFLFLFLLNFVDFVDAKFVKGTEGLVNLEIIPENQTKFVNEIAEYKLIVEVKDTGADTKCNLDGEKFIVKRGSDYRKIIEKRIYPRTAEIVNFSHNLYCEAEFVSKEINFWNITKFGTVSFIPYPINFSVKFPNETIKIDCENQEKILKFVVENKGKQSISCNYEKIFGILETGTIPSPIKYGEKSEFYLNFSINEIPETMIKDIKNISAKVRILCYDAYNSFLVKEENLTIFVNLSIREKILKCERKINEIKKFVDVSDAEEYLNKAKKYENLKLCSTSEIYADRCLLLMEEKEKEIKEARKKEELIKEKREKALNKINELREKILKLNYTKSEKAKIFIDNANSMLSAAQDKFLKGDYDYAITASEQGIENINYAMKVIEEEKKEEEKKKIEEEIKEKKEENITKNETLQVEEKFEEKQFDFMPIIVIVLLFIVIILILLIIKYAMKKKKQK